VTHGSGTDAPLRVEWASSLSVTGGSLTLNPGSSTQATSALTVGGAFSSLILATDLSVPTVTVSGGGGNILTVNTSKTLTVTSALTVNGGSLAGAGATTVA